MRLARQKWSQSPTRRRETHCPNLAPNSPNLQNVTFDSLFPSLDIRVCSSLWRDYNFNDLPRVYLLLELDHTQWFMPLEATINSREVFIEGSEWTKRMFLWALYVNREYFKNTLAQKYGLGVNGGLPNPKWGWTHQMGFIP